MQPEGPTPDASRTWVAPALLRVAIQGLCPQCGAPTLFAGTLRFASRCPSCSLDIESFNVGDGAAAFLIFIIAALVFIGVIVVQLAYSPPWWVHVMIWAPVTLILTIGLLRVSKAALLAAEFRNAAREGRRIS